MTSLFSDLPLPGLGGAGARPDAESHLPRVMAPREEQAAADGGARPGSLVADALLEVSTRRRRRRSRTRAASC